jgi:predicted TIM-barrel fold metal-dependent hydrolase
MTRALGVPVNFTARKHLRIAHESRTGENRSGRFGVAADLGRREFLAGLAAIGAEVLLSRNVSATQTATAAPHRIDVHNHLTPTSYAAELGPKHLLSAPVLNWTPAKDLEDMDAAGVATAITSLAPPGVWNGDDAIARSLARKCNDEAARLVADHKGRFGMFVNLPMPDVEGSLREIEYGLDTLKADGVAMYTSYGDKWLGDRAFDPVFDELNRRGAVVYTHPKSANCCKNVLANIPDSEIEYGTDTTRAITQLVFGGTTRRCPNVRMIFSHAGGSMPFLVERFVNLAKSPAFASHLPQGFLAEATKLYYDTAQTSNAAAMSALLKVVPVSQILFGTDFPFRTAADHVKGLKECGVFTPKNLRDIDRENALRLLPRFRT